MAFVNFVVPDFSTSTMLGIVAMLAASVEGDEDVVEGSEVDVSVRALRRRRVLTLEGFDPPSSLHLRAAARRPPIRPSPAPNRTTGRLVSPTLTSSENVRVDG